MLDQALQLYRQISIVTGGTQYAEPNGIKIKAVGAALGET